MWELLPFENVSEFRMVPSALTVLLVLDISLPLRIMAVSKPRCSYGKQFDGGAGDMNPFTGYSFPSAVAAVGVCVAPPTALTFTSRFLPECFTSQRIPLRRQEPSIGSA